MQTQGDVRNLPPDITFSRYVEWLVDRKRIPADWRKRLTVVRARILKEFSSLPRDIDPYFHTFVPEDRIGVLKRVELSCRKQLFQNAGS